LRLLDVVIDRDVCHHIIITKPVIPVFHWLIQTTIQLSLSVFDVIDDGSMSQYQGNQR